MPIRAGTGSDDNQYMDRTAHLNFLQEQYDRASDYFESFTDYCDERTRAGNILNRIMDQIIEAEAN